MNKKVKNASNIISGGIEFHSHLEKYFYDQAISENLPVQYENKTYVLLQGFRPNNVEIYIRSGRNKIMKPFSSSIRDVTYTPDFEIEIDGKRFIIEIKGFPNDVYPLKRKLFLSIVNHGDSNIYFFEPRTKADVDFTINEIKKIAYAEKD